MSIPRPTKRQKIADLICEDIKHWIVMEKLKPGDRLPNEKALMEGYECAKGTIREALRVLEIEGLIRLETDPGGGAIIHEVTIDPASRALRNYLHFQHVDSSQVYQLRRRVEVEIADLVVGRLDAFTVKDRARVRELMHKHVCDAEHHMSALESEMANQFLASPDSLTNTAHKEDIAILKITTITDDLHVSRNKPNAPNRDEPSIKNEE